MATLMWQRDIAGEASGVKDTLSSWDSCMSKNYCKWPVIAVIIFGCLIALSLLWCLFRCLCCGAECCCGCLACCNACCPSPRRKNRGGGYEQPPPPPPQYGGYPQYANPQPPMMYGGAGYRGPQTATFDELRKPAAAARYNEDALPAMPSWDHAQSRHVEDDVEMEKLDQYPEQQQSLLSNQHQPQPQHQQNRFYSNQPPATNTGGDLGMMHASPYQDYDAPRQATHSPSVYSQSTAYQPHGQGVTSPTSMYEPSLYPPSYHTQAPSNAADVGFGQARQIGRKPVQGSWRDV